ncbi:MAG TPA: hypothetical protein VF733_01260 [Candidatus Saccharimonadales bacterium]
MISQSIEYMYSGLQNGGEPWRNILTLAGQVAMNHPDGLTISMNFRSCNVGDESEAEMAAKCIGGPFARFAWATPPNVRLPVHIFMHDFPVGYCRHRSDTGEELLTAEYDYLNKNKTNMQWRKSGLESFVVLAGSMRFVKCVKAPQVEKSDKIYTLRPHTSKDVLVKAHRDMAEAVTPYLRKRSA